ncbi:hypothetical protein TBH_C1698 [Thiolapillus brandeum]|uniref:SLH domain-containing protein n=1 Tax=Thiolapillus brandeum TaxID=1076588 RepID=A0A7U6GJB0_9GAMM|nr:hypothetical protein TBH_C1698 [Thiolapillus brandeum]
MRCTMNTRFSPSICFSGIFFLTGFLLLLPAVLLAGAASPKSFSLEQRVACQQLVEDINWSYQIWPEANPGPKPSRRQILSDTRLRTRVEDALAMEEVLGEDFGIILDQKKLQTEMDRMAAHTRAPDRLRELFSVLGNDPAAVAECLVRPTMAKKLLHDAYRHGRNALQTGHEQAFGDWWKHRKSHLKPKWHAPALNGFRLPEVTGNALSLPEVAGPVPADSWSLSAGYVPEGRKMHTAVWTGNEMIVWGGQDNANNYTNSGARYLPVTDSWHPINTTGAPVARYKHKAVWTGSEMIVWGGLNDSSDDSVLNSGGRYNPATDTWMATSTTGVPGARADHTLVWADGEMIVWGGYDGNNDLNTGGRYDPATDTWVATTVAGAPVGGQNPAAVWTGSEMIVWGGGVSNTGGRYDPSTDTWTATSSVNAPAGRNRHTAVWTGNEMIVWGGYGGGYLNSGGRYDPSTDSWTATSLNDAPSGRYFHSAIWTGNQMIVWGGSGAVIENTGGRYDPSTDSWTSTSTAGAPNQRTLHTAVWTGSEMIVWGGRSGDPSSGYTGGRYDPTTDSWIETRQPTGPTGRRGQTGVWTGNEMIIWGGMDDEVVNTGSRYSPVTDTWLETTTTYAPNEKAYHSAVWTGIEMVVWGGIDRYYQVTNTGGRYNPLTDSWQSTALLNAPEGRGSATVVWTGTEMIVWGGHAGLAINTGGRYDPATDSWTAVSQTNAPGKRDYPTAVWTGSEMIIWGGQEEYINVDTGGRYDPLTDTWTETTLAGAPAGRYQHTAVWTGTEMIIWGGGGSSGYVNTGGRYDPQSDSWQATGTTNAPSNRRQHTAVWTGSEMVVWGGDDGNNYVNTGGRYDPQTDTWLTTSTLGAPVGRVDHSALWTGAEMLVWGGGRYRNIGIYHPYQQTFADVPPDFWSYDFIETLVANGITHGCGGDNYCPDNTVTRAQMSVFLERGMHGSSYVPPPASGTVFNDVAQDHWAANWIEQLAADGITGGCGAGNFCPENNSTRAEMAVFLLRAEHGEAYSPPPATGTEFADVPLSYWAAAWIEQLVSEGITSGCGGGNYCPSGEVTRGEMAVFLVRTFNLQ